MQVEVKTTKDDRSLTFPLEIGQTVEENINLFGEDVVQSIFKAQAVIKAQAYVRSLMSAKKEDGSLRYDDNEISEKFSEWKLTGGNRVVKSKEEKALELLQDMSPEKLQEVLERAAELAGSQE